MKPLHIDKPKTGHQPASGPAREAHTAKLDEYAAQIKAAKKRRDQHGSRKGHAW